jgi:branched-chain amino acid transport system substrate-binding protein
MSHDHFRPGRMKLAGRFLAIGLIAIGTLSAAVTTSAAQDRPIRIGSFTATSGGAAFLGDPQEKTLKLYVDKINKAGGIGGRKIELFHYDSAGDARQAVTFVRRLIEDNQVDVIMGGTTTGETMAVIPMVQEAGVPFISFAGGNVVVEPVRKWVFKTPGSDRMAVMRIFEDMKKRGFTKVAVLSGDGGFDQSCRAEAKSQAAKSGLTIAADEAYAQADTDLAPQFSRISSAGAQAILGCGFGVGAVVAVRNHQQLGSKLPLYFTHGVGAQQFVDAARGAAEGVRVTVSALLVADQLAADDPQRETVLKYAKEFEAAYGTRPAAFGGFAYDALFIALEAAQRAGKLDRAAIRDEIERTKGFVGIDGIFNMTPLDHMGLSYDIAFRLTEIRNNGWHLVK